MKIIKSNFIEIGIIKAGKGEPFHWKRLVVPHRASMADMKYDSSGSATDCYNTTHYLINHYIQIFWLWFIIYIDLKKEKLSEEKYVKYDTTHYAMIDEQLKE